MTEMFWKGRTSRKLAIAVLCLAPLAVMPAGCKLFRHTPLQSTVNTRDPRAAGQLLSGFYGVESAAWRWTSKQFSVKLKTPAGAAEKGGTLSFSFNIPPEVIEKSGTITLSGKAGGVVLAPETYSAPGSYVYKRDVPGSELGKSDLTVDFALDKSMFPEGVDRRELGVVAVTIALQSK